MYQVRQRCDINAAKPKVVVDGSVTFGTQLTNMPLCLVPMIEAFMAARGLCDPIKAVSAQEFAVES